MNLNFDFYTKVFLLKFHAVILRKHEAHIDYLLFRIWLVKTMMETNFPS